MQKGELWNDGDHEQDKMKHAGGFSDHTRQEHVKETVNSSGDGGDEED